MKVITEDILRDELRGAQPNTYYVPDGMILSPAGREYLQQRKIKIAKDIPLTDPEVKVAATEVPPMPSVPERAEKPKFVDYETGALYLEKPEHMTHLYGNVLVPKDHPRILFRGRLDSLQALVVLAQVRAAREGRQKLLDDLDDILGNLRELMRCDVLEEEFKNESIIGLDHAQLRERSHDPMKFFGVKPMVLAHYSMGESYARLNQLRTAVRETEVAAARAFRVGNRYTRRDIIQELNRLSSALHIMTCKYLAGDYEK